MQEAAVPLLTTWQNFYVIIGSSSAALIGLVFVVITLVAGLQERRGGEAFAAYSTPTVVHFGATLLVAAILSAPWQELWNAGLLLGICGLAGVIYVIIVLRRARHQTDYQPVLEDWLWHTLFPFVSYAAFVVAAIMLPGNPVPTLFIIGAATVLLVFIGIHNAWDTVTYLAIERARSNNESQDERASSTN
jgi:hypothetical protein